MTEHSMKELKRQYDAAKSRYRESKGKMQTAQKAYYGALIADEAARLEREGMTVGSVVGASYRGVLKGRYILHSFEIVPFEQASARLCKIKGDGTPYANPVSVWFDEIKPVTGEA